MKRKKAIMLIMAAALVCQPMTALADAAPDGSDETEMNFAWYS